MKQEATPLTYSQRRSLVKLLSTDYTGEIWDKLTDKYNEVRSTREQQLIRAALSPKRRKQIADIKSLRAKLEILEDDLWANGLRIESDGDIDILHSDRTFNAAIRKHLNEELGTLTEAVTNPVRLARAKILLAATTEEAKKIMEPLLQRAMTVK